MVSGEHAPEVRVLSGTVSVTRLGRTAQPAGNMARLLSLLVCRADEPVSVGEIKRAVWPEAVDSDSISRGQVERLVSGLRDLLGDAERAIIPIRKHDRYRLQAASGRVWVDCLEFERLARAAHESLESGDDSAARRHAAEALALWQSDPVVELDEWADLLQRHRAVLLAAAEAATRAGDHGQAVAELAAFVRRHPEDEAGWTLLVQARLREGERVLAAQACLDADRRLVKLGGMGPKLAEICGPLTALPEASATRDGGPLARAGPPASWPQPDAAPEPESPRTAWVRRAGAALLVAALAAASAILVAARGERPETASITVFNLEKPCQKSRSPNCLLGLARDPNARYGAQNVIRYVGHGDVLAVECFLTNGVKVVGEDGSASTRWYRVAVERAVGDDPAWLPGIRVRPGTRPPVPRCPST